MKKIFIPFVIAATTLSFAACQKEASSPAIEDELVSLNFTSANPTTKTVADAVNKTILWEKGDKISIAYTVNGKWQNATGDAKLVGDRWIDIQNGNILGPKPITDANILTINGTNLKVNKNNVEFWAAVMPATVKSLKIVVETNKATYTRNIESCNIEFKQNARKGLNVDMSSVERVEKEAPASWIATDLADITATDEVVITMANDKSVYALTSAKGSSAAPTAVAVTVKNKELTATPADNLVWNIANDNGNLTIYPKGQTTTWLYTTNDNNGVRVGKNENKTFVVDSKSGYLKNTTTSRYLGVYNNSYWRCYTSTSTNIGGQTL